MLGTGIIKGLYITAKNLVGSYHDPRRLPTIEYPEKRYTLPENFRSFPFLVYDGDDANAGLRCVACRICEKECPPQCIYIVPERDAKGRVQKKPKIFDIDYSVCMGCQLCVESCPFDSIKMDHHYEITATDRFEGLLVHLDQLAKPNSYFHQIHPADAAEIDARRAEDKRKAEARAKAAAATKASAGTSPAGASHTGTPHVETSHVGVSHVGASLAKPVVKPAPQLPNPAPRAAVTPPRTPEIETDTAGQVSTNSTPPTQRASQAKPLHAPNAAPPAATLPAAPPPAAPPPDAA